MGKAWQKKAVSVFLPEKQRVGADRIKSMQQSNAETQFFINQSSLYLDSIMEVGSGFLLY